MKPRHEKRIAGNLALKGYSVFLPLTTHRHKNGTTAEVPLFPSYIFCNLDPDRVLPIMMTPNVFSIVGDGVKAFPVPEEEIDKIKQLVESGFPATSWPYVSAGQEITINSGPLRGVTGIFVRSDNYKWLVVSINMLRRSVAVKFDLASFETPSDKTVATAQEISATASCEQTAL